MNETILLEHLVDTQHEQTQVLARIEANLEGLAVLRAKVDELAQESRDTKTAIKTLKWVGGLVLSLLSLIVTFATGAGKH
jgi:hypothetical protein